MNTVWNFGEYFVPICAAERDGVTAPFRNPRLLGSAFYIGEDGLFATCAHVLRSKRESEVLCAMDLRTREFETIGDVRLHTHADFGVGRVSFENTKWFRPQRTIPIRMGDDAMSFGFVSSGRSAQGLDITWRLLKGHIVRVDRAPPPMMRAVSTCELSYPAVSGFSGTAVLTPSKPQLLGLLYQSREITIQAFGYEERLENGNVERESVHRVVEFGLAHVLADIEVFLEELGVEAFK